MVNVSKPDLLRYLAYRILPARVRDEQLLRALYPQPCQIALRRTAVELGEGLRERALAHTDQFGKLRDLQPGIVIITVNPLERRAELLGDGTLDDLVSYELLADAWAG